MPKRTCGECGHLVPIPGLPGYQKCEVADPRYASPPLNYDPACENFIERKCPGFVPATKGDTNE